MSQRWNQEGKREKERRKGTKENRNKENERYRKR